jgi:hypothetical protein
MYLYDTNSLAFFAEIKMFQIKAVEKTTTHILHSKTFLLIVLFMRQKYAFSCLHVACHELTD